MLTDIVTSKSEAKKDIQGALTGLLLILGAVVILNVINPNLTRVTFDPERVVTPDFVETEDLSPLENLGPNDRVYQSTEAECGGEWTSGTCIEKEGKTYGGYSGSSGDENNEDGESADNTENTESANDPLDQP